MTQKEKQDKLAKLDTLLLDKMLAIMESGDTEELSDLTPVINVLRNNQMVADKPKSTVDDEIKKRVAAAEKRRKKRESV